MATTKESGRAAAAPTVAAEGPPAAADRPDDERAGPLGALQSRPFRLFWLTITLSLTGDWVPSR